jgi:CHRD domain-containing protein
MAGKLVGLAAAAVLVAGCSAEQQPMPTDYEISVPLFAQGGNADFNIQTHLTGDEEPLPTTPPTPAESPAQGQAIFRVNAAGTSVDFRLIASNITNVVQAHIHCGPPGVNGPIRMWLFPNVGTSGTALTTANGRQDGVLATGTFNPTGVVCPASAVGSDMPLLTAMRGGLAYVNVHTNDFIAPTNTGPGDFPVGEIRGQLDQPNSQ